MLMANLYFLHFFKVGVYAACICRVSLTAGCSAVSLGVAGHDIYDYPENGNSQISSFLLQSMMKKYHPIPKNSINSNMRIYFSINS